MIRRTVSLAAVVLCTVVLSGCATTQRPDPLESLNRATFAFNEKVDQYVIAPPARVYRDTVPSVVRKGVTNFFNNLRDAWSAINLMLQGRPADGIQDAMRFSVNTVLGFGGLLDWGREIGLQPHYEDFGQTLGRWGVGPGAYLVLPILGPSTLRDTAALPLDFKASVELYVDDIPVRNSLIGLRIVNTRADLLSASQLLEDIALDKYLFVRDAYLQRRRSLIYDGNPPEEDTEEPATPAGTPPP